MSLKKRLKLLLSLVVLCACCAALVIYENNAIATIGASSASIMLPTYTIGAEYDGLIVKQYVNVGDYVSKNQQLFELKSDQLTAEIASHNLQAYHMNYTVASDGGFILSAQHGGVVSQINSLSGSFVNAGTVIAVITGTSGANARANFELSGPEYAKVQPATPIEVSFGGHTMHGTISGITQQSVNGHTITTINASLPTITIGQTMYATGTPASAKLILDNHTLYQRLASDLKPYMRKLHQ